MKPVLRFAPSPTGTLHLGGLRTALICHALARKHDGTFFIRIEDTDTTRTIPGSEESLISTLAKFNIKSDLPVFKQSDRGPIYEKYAEQLFLEGKAYYCLNPESCLPSYSKTSKRKQKPFRCLKCRSVEVSEAQERLKSIKLTVLRQKLPDDIDTVSFKDQIHGNLSIAVNELDEQVLLKSNKIPTYHLASVVDDHLYGVTNVVRGVEWLTSAPKHVLLYDSFGWKSSMPEFTHLPLILNEKGEKLSKRHQDLSIETLLSTGYFVDTIISYLLSIGYSSKYKKNNDDDYAVLDEEEEEKEDAVVRSVDEIYKNFNLKKIKNNNVQVNFKRLIYLNSELLKHKIENKDKEVEIFLKSKIKEYNRINHNTDDKREIEDEYFWKCVDLVKDREPFLEKIFTLCYHFFIKVTESRYKQYFIDFKINKEKQIEEYDIINMFMSKIEVLNEDNWTETELSNILGEISTISKERGYKVKAIYVIRKHLTGLTKGAKLSSTLCLLGREELMNRVNFILVI